VENTIHAASNFKFRKDRSAPTSPRCLRKGQQGKYSLIVDALDEGRILSGEKNFEEFLRTTFELLAAPADGSSPSPKILLFGRPEAARLTNLILEMGDPKITVTTLVIDYFDEPAASALVLESARSVSGAEYVNRHLKPIQQVIKAFFGAISKAIQVSAEDLWSEERGRSFAGYAPVLAALGALVGKEENMNYQKLLQRLQDTGPTDAWDVLERVASAVLEREADKVRKPLAASVGADLAPGAYDPQDQLDLLAAVFAGLPFRVAGRLVFGSPAASVAYRDVVKTHMNDHPFLRDGAPANDVLGALVMAHAIATGIELSGGLAPRLLAVYGRQPFVWRFIRRRFGMQALVTGDVVPFVLGSLWSDELLAKADISVVYGEGGQDPARLRIIIDGRATEVDVITPLVLRGVVRTIKVDLPSGELVLAGWPDSEAPAMAFLGNAELRAGTVRFEVKRLQVGALGLTSSCGVRAENALGDQQLAIDMHSGSSLTVAGIFENRYPWVFHLCCLPATA
jgi:hypothetical protein